MKTLDELLWNAFISGVFATDVFDTESAHGAFRQFKATISEPKKEV